MAKVTLTNTTDNPFVTPNNVTIPARGAAEVNDFQNVESNDVVKAWLDGGFLVKGDVTDDLIDNASGNNQAAGGTKTDSSVAFVAKSDDELNGLTNPALAQYIEEQLGGEVKSGSTKADLVKQAQELQAAKAAK